MTSEQFMEKMFDLAYYHLKKAGVSIFITAIVSLVLYIRMDRQETKYEAKLEKQEKKYTHDIDSLGVELKTNIKMTAECDVERAVLKAEMASLKKYVLKNKVK